MMADEIETEIVNAVIAVGKQASAEGWETPRWASAIKKALAQIGKRRGFYVCGSPEADGQYISDQKQQWLYDHTWLNNEVPTGMPLALECEWGNQDAIDHDFQKIVFSRADHRVMIFQAYRLAPYFERLIKQIRECRYTQPGDRYLLLGWDLGQARFEVRVFAA
jgi:hypothetical protein